MPQDIRQLTALRFFAAMWVVGYDYWPRLQATTPAILAKGYLGVDLFFVLSGFILSHVYLNAFGERRASYRGFLWARLARIYPLHLAILLMLAGIALIAGAIGLHLSGQLAVWPSIPGQLLLLQAWGTTPRGGWNHPAWSISAEWLAYLAFPAFAWVFWRLRHRLGLALVLAVIAVVGVSLGFARITGQPLTHQTIAWGALRIVPCFFYGGVVYLIWRAAPAGRHAALAGLVVALGVVAVLTVAKAEDWSFTLVFGGLIYALASLASQGSRLLAGAVWVYLGEVSFAIYMVCIPWQLVFELAAKRAAHWQGGLMEPTLWAGLAAGIVPAAMIAHHLIERPARRAMRAYGPQPSRAAFAAGR
jgi:peptidoglycan/LPS O-acetylase OafA/YrhL